MILRKWEDPNYKFRATDDEDVAYEHFCYAVSQRTLEKRLHEKNLKIEWIKLYDFQEWKDRAVAATARAIAAHDKAVAESPLEKPVIGFRDSLWGELKWHLFELFQGKCAYCECKPQVGADGDVEHYRPKSKVDEDPAHHGYYWLAYDYRNLLPSCGPCNRARAKMTHFPIMGGDYQRSPETAANEEPLLLNPFNEALDPYEHLEFIAGGAVRPHNGSQRGEQSRIYYHLNRPALSEARRAALMRVRQDWNVLAGIASSQDDAADFLRRQIKMGTREYSAAQLWELERLAGSTASPPAGG